MELFSRVTGAFPAGTQELQVAFMDIFFSAVPMIPLQKQLLGNFYRHIEIKHQIRPGQAQLAIFKILYPFQIAVPFLPRGFPHLIHHVGSGVPVTEDNASPVIILFPVFSETGKPVYRIKCAGRVGVYIFRVCTELSVQIHAH